MLRVVTLNVRGIKQPLKRAAAFLSLSSVPFDILFLQECHLCSEAEGVAFSKGWERVPSAWGIGDGRGDGVGVLFNSFDWVIEATVSVVPGRVLCVDGMGRGLRFRAIAVYAPCRVGQRRGFFCLLEPILGTNRLLLIGGDFNVDVEAEGGGELAQVMAGAGLMDVYRVVEPQAPGYTWRNSRGDTARLDLLFVAEGARVQSCVLEPFWGSDHCMVVGSIQLEVGTRGRGLWRLNTSALQDPTFCTVFRHLYAGWKRMRCLYATQVEWWEDLKRRVAILCRWWGQEIARRKREKANVWSRKLYEAWKYGDHERLREASEAL
ncbi:uncharacterized protein LOC121397172, partial [Tachysurus ichikawai]